MSGGRVCAIHQPNLFPRWVTLAKLLVADTWMTPGWPRIEGVVDAVADVVGAQQGLAAVAEMSTSLLLRACGWSGKIVRSSALARQGSISTERSERLADLTRAAGCGTYLCGRSGRSYLHLHPFDRAGTAVEFFELPAAQQGPLADLTALATLAARPVGSSIVSA